MAAEESALSEYLFIGGPLHGQRKELTNPLSVLHYRLSDPHKPFRVRHEVQLEGILELREIEALTGRTYHRPDRPPFIAEDLERDKLMIREYRLVRFFDGREESAVYVFDGLTDSHAVEYMRTGRISGLENNA